MSAPTAKIQISIQLWEVISSGVKAGTIPSSILENFELANGTTDGLMCDKVFAKTETGIAASATTAYDLAGALFDIDGNTIAFAEVCLIAVRNKRSTALAWLSVGPAAANGFGALAGGKGFWNAALGAGGGSLVGPSLSTGQSSWTILYDATGVPVTPGTGDLLHIIASAVVGNINSWDIIIIGRSA